jgi:hypothetical protein
LSLQAIVEAVKVASAVKALDSLSRFRAAIVNPAIKYTVWRYVVEGLAPSPNICGLCYNRRTDFYELKDPDDLGDMFPYGEWLDDDNFAVNQHPYCRCIVVRDHDVYY